MDSVIEVEKKADAQIRAADSSSVLREIEHRFLGKQGELTQLAKLLGTLPSEQKPQFGKVLNEAKARIAEAIESRISQIKVGEEAARFSAEKIDVTLPSRKPRLGIEHVLQQTMNRIKDAFVGLGFEYIETPELEEFRYNFSALNYPDDHPAMDEQDTFYITDELLLRTQGTSFQGRVFETTPVPFRKFTITRCFRNEAVDRTHSHTFHQIDAFMVDEGVNMAHLKGTLKLFAEAMFGGAVKVRFRPDFFPFVEPGVDYAISSPKLFNGKWVELGGAGLIHPNILERYGIDTEKYSGWAFGLGVERIPMMAYGIDDLRLFLENDTRFLEQFS